jgi:hypothetical protein
LVETRLKELRDKLPEALDPAVVGALLLTIANSDGTRLRWPADELSTMVIGALFGKSDTERDDFLRGAAGSDWWSKGKDAPDS